MLTYEDTDVLTYGRHGSAHLYEDTEVLTYGALLLGTAQLAHSGKRS